MKDKRDYENEVPLGTKRTFPPSYSHVIAICLRRQMNRESAKAFAC